LRREENGKNWRGPNAEQIKNRILRFLESGPKSYPAIKDELKTGYDHYLKRLIKEGRVTKTGAYQKARYWHTRIRSEEIRKRAGDENGYRLAREWAESQRTEALEELLPCHEFESAKTVRRALEDELEYRRLCREDTHLSIGYDS
jgi:hypothetical protein